MAQIFAGNLSQVDPDILDQVQTLPDDFWVFAEFDATGRNIDWFISRAVPAGAGQDQHSTLIVTEQKRVARPIDGTTDGPWRVQTEVGTWQEIEPPNREDLNYYWQAVHSANSLAHWLWSNQRRYMGNAELRPQQEFKVWPDLLIVSPPDVIHRLPVQPPSRFGQWWFEPETWLRHIESWMPRVGVPLGKEQLSQLAETLGLSPIETSQSTPASDQPKTLDDFLSWMKQLPEQMAHLEERVKRLEERIR